MAKRNDIKAFKKFVVTFEGEDMDMPEEANLSDFETFEDFKAHLKKHRIKYNESDGVFTKRDDEYSWWIWDADDKGNSLGWLYMFLEQLTGTYWDEMCENVFATPDCPLEVAFNALKKLESLEFGVDEDGDVFDGDGDPIYINEEN
jgi:hypothetical protein